MRYQPPYVEGDTPAVSGIHNADADASYSNGDALAGIEGSYVPGEAVEHTQREIMAIITGAGLTPDVGDLAQAAKAIQGGHLIQAIDSGAASAIVVTLAPVPDAYPKFLVIKAAAAPTGATTIAINALATVAVKRADGTAIQANDYSIDAVLLLGYDGTAYRLLAGSQTVSGQVVYTGTDGGTANSHVLSQDGSLATFTSLVDGLVMIYSAAATNTGAVTTTDFGLASKSIVDWQGNALIGGEIVAGRPIARQYSSALGKWKLLPWASAQTVGGQVVYTGLDTGTASAHVLNQDGTLPTITALADGLIMIYPAAATNAGAVTTTDFGLASKSIVDWQGNALIGGEIVAGRPIARQYSSALGKWKLLPWASALSENYLITTAITITIGGSGTYDQATLAAAIEWLARRRITSTGSVVVQLPSGQMALGSSLIDLTHPDGQRITIQGAALTGGGFPADANITITGSSSGARATDTAAALTVLRARIPTELQFTGAGGLRIGNIGLVQRLLVTHATATGSGITLTGDVRLKECADVSAVDGIYAIGGSPTLENVMSVGASNDGIAVHRANAVVVTAASAYSAVQHGIFIDATGSLAELYQSNASINGRGNGSAGMTARLADVMLNGLCNFSNNAVYGVDVALGNYRMTGAKINSNGSHGALVGYSANLDITPISGQVTEAKNNGGWGLYAVSNGKIHCGSSAVAAVLTGNTSGAANAYVNAYIDIYGATCTSQSVAALDGSFIRATAATGATLSPAANTLGNSNSYIKV